MMSAAAAGQSNKRSDKKRRKGRDDENKDDDENQDDDIYVLSRELILRYIYDYDQRKNIITYIQKMEDRKKARSLHDTTESLLGFITIVLGLIDSLHDFYNVKKINENKKNAIQFYLLLYLKREIIKWIESNHMNITSNFYNEVNSICLYIEGRHIGLYEWTIKILNLKDIKSPFLSFPDNSHCKNTFQITFIAFLQRHTPIRIEHMSIIVNNIKFNGIINIFRHFECLDERDYNDFRLYDNILLYRNLIYNIIKNIQKYLKFEHEDQRERLNLIERLLKHLDTLFNINISGDIINILIKENINRLPAPLPVSSTSPPSDLYIHNFIEQINSLVPYTYPSLYIYDQGIEHIYLTGHKLYIDKKTDEGAKQTFKSVNETSFERVLKFTQPVFTNQAKHNVYGIEYDESDVCLFSDYTFIPASGEASGEASEVAASEVASVAASGTFASSSTAAASGKATSQDEDNIDIKYEPQELQCFLEAKLKLAVRINSISAITNELLQLNNLITNLDMVIELLNTIGCFFGAKRTGDWLQCIQAKKYNILISTGDFWCQMYALLTQTPIIIDDILYNYNPKSELNINKWMHFMSSNLKTLREGRSLDITDNIHVDMFKNMLLKDIIKNYGSLELFTSLPESYAVSSGAGAGAGTASASEAASEETVGKQVLGLQRSQTQTMFSHNDLNIRVSDLKYILKKYLKYKNKYLKKTGRIIDNHEMDAITNNLFENVNESNIKQNIEKINNKYLKYKNKYLRINI